MKLTAIAVAALALVLAPLGGAQPAAAAPGFHAAYFSESAFLNLIPGQTGQFSVGFTNTGDQPWVRGVASSQASLHTAAPLDSPVDSLGGWNQGWAAPNIYAVQSNELVAPNQIGFFVYNIKVPVGTAHGVKSFYGRPAIDGVGYLEDYGYYQSVTISGGVLITTSSPASPSANNRPLITGTGAAASELVSIKDGAGGTVVGSINADAAGNFSVPVTTGLSVGSHNLIASTISKGEGAPFPYVVQATNGPVVVDAYATASNTIVVRFSAAMKCVATTGRNDLTNPNNYFTNVGTSGAAGPAVSTATASSDCTSVTLLLGSTLTSGTTYTVIAYFVQDSAGTNIDTTRNTASFDTYRSVLGDVVGKADGTLRITFTKSMNTSGGAAGSTSVLNPTYYTIDNVTAASTTVISCAVPGGANGCVQVLLTFTGGSGSVIGAAGTVHTVSVSSVTDAGNSGQTMLVNPSSRQFATVN